MIHLFCFFSLSVFVPVAVEQSGGKGIAPGKTRRSPLQALYNGDQVTSFRMAAFYHALNVCEHSWLCTV